MSNTQKIALNGVFIGMTVYLLHVFAPLLGVKHGLVFLAISGLLTILAYQLQIQYQVLSSPSKTLSLIGGFLGGFLVGSFVPVGLAILLTTA